MSTNYIVDLPFSLCLIIFFASFQTHLSEKPNHTLFFKPTIYFDWRYIYFFYCFFLFFSIFGWIFFLPNLLNWIVSIAQWFHNTLQFYRKSCFYSDSYIRVHWHHTPLNGQKLIWGIELCKRRGGKNNKTKQKKCSTKDSVTVRFGECILKQYRFHFVAQNERKSEKCKRYTLVRHTQTHTHTHAHSWKTRASRKRAGER